MNVQLQSLHKVTLEQQFVGTCLPPCQKYLNKRVIKLIFEALTTKQELKFHWQMYSAWANITNTYEIHAL